MRTVSATDLKYNLSRYLKRVKNGEVILVSCRGEIIAEIRKPLSIPENELNVKRSRN
jgi:antitoxin (DNA-binding transcriptional repressor) of toxin-antitoxin stability system